MDPCSSDQSAHSSRWDGRGLSCVPTTYLSVQKMDALQVVRENLRFIEDSSSALEKMVRLLRHSSRDELKAEIAQLLRRFLSAVPAVACSACSDLSARPFQSIDVHARCASYDLAGACWHSIAVAGTEHALSVQWTSRRG